MTRNTDQRTVRDARSAAHDVAPGVAVLAARLARFAGIDGVTATSIPFLSLLRSSRPTLVRAGVVRPSVCLIVQGKKRIHLGGEIVGYGPGQYLAATIDMPASGQVVGASRSAPYLGLAVELARNEIASVLMEARLQLDSEESDVAPAFVGRSDAQTLDVYLRLVTLLDSPRDAAFLAPALKRELIYRLLTGPSGHLFRRNVMFDRHELGIGKALEWLRGHFDRPLRIEELARASNMSVSSLHHKFKAVTAMGPLQYQKRLRLEEARRRLVGGSADVTGAAFGVGYESASQFSREYRKLFGLPPSHDLRRLRIELAPTGDEL